MTNRKALFFDIDGTILTPPPFSIPDSTRLGLKLARENGHLTFINTGRIFGLVPEEIKKMDFDGFVCGCGTQIYINGRQLFHSTLPHSLCAETVAAMKRFRVPAIYEDGERLLYDSTSPVEAPSAEIFRNLTCLQDISTLDPEEAKRYTFGKFLVQLIPESDRKGFLDFCNGHFVCFDHGHDTYEITQKSCTKASGIAFVLEQLGLSREDSYAFGDSSNDLDMLKFAGTSIAMGNSMKEILPFCTYQTTDVDKDGILNALLYYGLIQKEQLPGNTANLR